MNVSIKAVPENKLTTLQLTHLKVARQVAGSVPVYPASMHNSAKIIGAYRLQSGPIYIAPERLLRLRYTMNTTIHELGHHESQADDGSKAHDQAMSRITRRVSEMAREGTLDAHLGGVIW